MITFEMISLPLVQFPVFLHFLGRPLQVMVHLCYGTIVLSVYLSLTLVYCGQMVGWIKMPLGTEVGLAPGDIVLDGDPQVEGRSSRPTFRPMSISAHVYCGQTVAHLSNC